MDRRAALVCFALAVLGGGVLGALAQSCPPEGYDSVPDFDIDAYIGEDASPWYIQQQQAISYQPEESLFCVRARYTRLANGRIGVDNSARIGGVDGPEQNAGNFQLNAVIVDEADPSKLAVGPPFLPPALYGPYWVVAVGPVDPETEEYEWAIVTGGAPNSESNGACVGSGRFQNEGFWLFTREQVAGEELIDEMRGVAEGLGLDTSVLVPVPQEGCEYTDAAPPPGAGRGRPARACSPLGGRCGRFGYLNGGFSGNCCSGECARPEGAGFFTPRRCLTVGEKSP